MRVGGILAALFFLFTQGLYAQGPSVVAFFDTTTVRIGDPFRLNLTLNYDPSMRPDMPDLSQLLQNFNPRCAPWSEQSLANGVQMTQPCQLRLFELGPRTVPAIEVVFVTAEGDTLARASQAVDIEVVSARREGEDQIRDIKPPRIVYGGIPLWIAVVLGVMVLALIGLLVYWLWRRRRQASTPAAVVEQPTDYAAEFGRIAGMDLLERGEFKTYYSLLSENLRRFLEDGLEIEAMEQTTSELSVALRAVQIESRLSQRIIEYLGTSDLVKFARFHPDIDMARRAPDAGLTLLQHVEGVIAARAKVAEDHAEHSV